MRNLFDILPRPVHSILPDPPAIIFYIGENSKKGGVVMITIKSVEGSLIKYATDGELDRTEHDALVARREALVAAIANATAEIAEIDEKLAENQEIIDLADAFVAALTPETPDESDVGTDTTPEFNPQ
jgi:hypothetical protein